MGSPCCSWVLRNLFVAFFGFICCWVRERGRGDREGFRIVYTFFSWREGKPHAYLFLPFFSASLPHFLGYKEIRLLCCAKRKGKKTLKASSKGLPPKKKSGERNETGRRRKNYANWNFHSFIDRRQTRRERDEREKQISCVIQCRSS